VTALPAASGQSDLVTKSEFARRRNVSPGRVSQWIAEGKIDGSALVGTGRDQRICESVAVEQLRRRTDAGQRLGNGITTRLDPIAPTVTSSPVVSVPLVEAPLAPESPATMLRDDVASKIQLAKLEQLERANRREAEEDALAAGTYVLGEEVLKEKVKMLRDVISSMDGALPDFANVIASRFNLPPRDVIHLLRTEFRKVRERIAALARSRGQQLPEFIEHDPVTAHHAEDLVS
jgi:hypothetical protein